MQHGTSRKAVFVFLNAVWPQKYHRKLVTSENHIRMTIRNQVHKIDNHLRMLSQGPDSRVIPSFHKLECLAAISELPALAIIQNKRYESPECGPQLALHTRTAFVYNVHVLLCGSFVRWIRERCETQQSRKSYVVGFRKNVKESKVHNIKQRTSKAAIEPRQKKCWKWWTKITVSDNLSAVTKKLNM